MTRLRAAATAAGWIAAAATVVFFALVWLEHEGTVPKETRDTVGVLGFGVMMGSGGFYLAVAPGLCGFYDGRLLAGGLVGIVADALGRPIVHSGARARFKSAMYVMTGTCMVIFALLIGVAFLFGAPK